MEKSRVADKDLRRAIVKTILYADLFDYPLSKKELWKYLIVDTQQSVSKKRFEECLSNNTFIDKKNGFYFLSGREQLVTIRNQRKKISLEKMKIAKRVAAILGRIPTVLLISVSGALAMENAHEADDIDFFVVVSTGTIWITRFFLLLLLHSIGMRRKRTDVDFSNKICLNMLIDEAHISFSKERQDIYTAHEISQMKPIFKRNGMGNVFAYSNIWVHKFLPNIPVSKRWVSFNISGLRRLVQILFIPFEFLARSIQLFYMEKYKTIELVTDGFLAFHPFDYRKVILQKFQKRLKKYATI